MQVCTAGTQENMMETSASTWGWLVNKPDCAENIAANWESSSDWWGCSWVTPGCNWVSWVNNSDWLVSSSGWLENSSGW